MGRTGFRSRVFLVALWLAVLSSALGVIDRPSASAAAPPPPLTGCLAQGSFDSSEPDCPGNPRAKYGMIGSVKVLTVGRTERITVSGPGGVALGTTPYTSCGGNGCPRFQMAWSGGDGVDFVSGCGLLDPSCTLDYRPQVIGDAGERYALLFAQPYLGIIPYGQGVVYALYTPPLIYPVQVHALTKGGAPLTIGDGVSAFAVAPGANPTESECLGVQWFRDYPSQTNLPHPTCIQLGAGSQSGATLFVGWLPDDSGTWTIVAGPGGDERQSLLSRPVGFRRTTVTPASDDMVTTIVGETQPSLDLQVIAAQLEMVIGSTQQVQVVVSALGGESGSLEHLTFVSPAILGVAVGDAPPIVEVLDTVEIIPAGGFAVERGAPRTFLVDVRAVGLGERNVDAVLSGRDLLASYVHASADARIVVGYAEPEDPGSGTGDAIPPPVVTSAKDVLSELDPIVGTVAGEPGSSVTVTLVMSRVVDGQECSRLMTGNTAKVLGSVGVDIGADGTGSFSMRALLAPGSYVYGIAVAGPDVSPVGECTAVTQDTPTISIEAATDVEGTAADVTTPFEFRVSLSSPSEQPVSVGVQTADGTAQSPTDYVALGATTLTFAPGERTKLVTVDVVADASEEPDDDFQVILTNAVNGLIEGDGVATGTIIDDDAAAATGDLDVRGKWTLTPVKTSGRNEVAITFQIKSQDPDTGDIAGSLKTEFGTLRFSGRVVGSKLTLKLKQGSVSGTLSGTLSRTGGTLTGVISGSNNEGFGGKYRVVIVPRGR